MKDDKTSNEHYLTEKSFEQENQVIAEAKYLLYQRLHTSNQVFSEPRVAKDYLCLQLSAEQREVFSCLFVDSQHRFLAYREIFVGTINSCTVYPREVVKAALKENAAAVIFAHNHPSGVPEPSQQDRRITRQLKEALSLLDIRVLDHCVVGGDRVVSFAERGLL